MPNQSKPAVPDTATTYERSKPENESPDGNLVNPPAAADKKPDDLKSNSAPATPPHHT